jgi:outer membrane protein assembly factor BamA
VILRAILFAVFVCPVFAADIWVVHIEVGGLPKDLPVGGGIIPKVPAVYDANAMKLTAYALARFLSENGYPYSRITTSVARDDSVAVTVHFLVEPDERVCAGEPVIRGAGGRIGRMYFRDVQIVPGQLYNSADVDETVRRLSMRPYVQNVTAESPIIVEDRQSLECEVRTAVTPITVAENRGLAVEGALGYESGRGGGSGSMSGRLDLSLINLLRMGETADVSYMGTSTFQRLKLSASMPWIFGLPFEAGGAAGLEIEDEGYGFFSGEFRTAMEVNARYRVGIAVKLSETVPPAGIDAPYMFYGADVFGALIPKPRGRGETVWEFSGRTGSGVANRERAYARSTMELTAGAHYPIFGDYALVGRVCAMSLFTDEEYLPPAEMYRIGGHGSLRGYFEEEFAFRTALYSQAEAHYYFNRVGSIFIFIDGGFGFDSPRQLSLSTAKEMLGYGVGIRFPSRLGTVSLEWARNMDDGWSLGRVHVGINSWM